MQGLPELNINNNQRLLVFFTFLYVKLYEIKNPQLNMSYQDIC